MVSLGISFSGEDKRSLLSIGCDLHQYAAAQNVEEALREAENADAVCVLNVWIRYLASDFMSRFRRCRLLVIGGAGTDMLKMEDARLRGITVANCPGYAYPSVAEHAFALILALARRWPPPPERLSSPGLAAYEEAVRRWQGVELRGKTLGIAGYGRIGQHLARIARGFGMKIIVFTRRPPWLPARHLWYRWYRHIRFVNFNSMLSQSDVIVSTLPNTPGTRGIFNADAFSRMRCGCLFVNVGRAQVIDEEALRSALEQGRIAGAGLDVASPLGARSLRPMENVLISPHMGWNTVEAKSRIGGECAENIVRFFSGRPINLIPDVSRMPPQ